MKIFNKIIGMFKDKQVYEFKIGDKVKVLKKHLGSTSFEQVLYTLKGDVGYIIRRNIELDCYEIHNSLSYDDGFYFTADELLQINVSAKLLNKQARTI